MHGLTITRIVWRPELQLGDAQIIFADPRAAAAYGFSTPTALIGRYHSTLQSRDARLHGRTSWALRQLGKAIPKVTDTCVLWPDGQTRGQQRVLGEVVKQGDGAVLYSTYVREGGSGSLPAVLPESFGVHRREIEAITGRYTVQDIHDGTHPIAQLKTFQYILEECEALSSTVYAGQYATPLDLALSSEVSVSWHADTPQAQTPPLVRCRLRCDACGWQWFGRVRERRMCPAPACRKWYAAPS